MAAFHYYCPHCGTTQFETARVCVHCRSGMIPVQSKNDFEYYREKSMELYGDYFHWHDILMEEEVKLNYFYSEEKEKYEMSQDEKDEILNDILKKSSNQQENVPKCPTCQSTRIKKISSSKKAIHGLTFGLFSKTARSQFECSNCGYKW